MSPWDSIGKIAVAKVANAVFSFIGLIWFSQTLGVGNLGMYFLFLALVGVSELFADMGINGAVEKEDQSR